MPVGDDVKLGAGVVIPNPELVNLSGCRIGAETKIGTFVEIQKNARIGACYKVLSRSFTCDGRQEHWGKFLSSRWLSLKTNPYHCAMAALVLAFAAVTFIFQCAIHDDGFVLARDVSFYDQSFWNAWHGNGLRTTIGSHGLHLFSEHLFLTQWLVLPIYGLWQDPRLLFLVQAVALGLSGAALYRVAQAYGASVQGSLALAALFLAHPSLHGAAAGIKMYGYHAETFFPALFFLAWEAQLKRRKAAFVAFFLLSLATIEYYAIVWGGVAAVWYVSGRRREALAVGSLAIAWFVAATFVAIPYFSGGKEPYYFTFGGLTAARLPPVLHALAYYAAVLIAGLAGLPLLSRISLAAIPIILTYARAEAVGYGVPLNVFSWHISGPMSIFAVAAAEGLVLVERRVGAPRTAVALLSCAVALATLTGARFYRQIEPPLPDARKAERARLSTVIPADAPLSASLFLAAHFAHRRDLWLFPVLGNAEWILVDQAPRLAPSVDERNSLADLKQRGRVELVSGREGYELYRVVR
jgi:Predicted membrane protein (DUF2079)